MVTMILISSHIQMHTRDLYIVPDMDSHVTCSTDTDSCVTCSIK